MNATENAALDLVAIRQDRKATNPRAFAFALFEELTLDGTAKNPIFKGILAKGETSAWIAGPGSLKSALLASAACCAAAGTDWGGFKNKAGPIGVIYFALERADLVKRRLLAHRERDGLANLPIAVVSDILNLMDSATVPRLVETIREIEQTMSVPVGLLIFDTFAKLIAAGGGDENKASDQGRVFTNIQRIKNGAGNPHVALIGHTGKDESRGARGSNAILGDADLMVTISGDNVRSAVVIKANDAAEGPLFSFKSEIHDFGPDDDGDPRTVNIVSAEFVEGAERVRSSRWPRGLMLVRDAVDAALIAHGENHRVGGDGPTVRAVEVRHARASHNQKYVSAGDGDRSEAERKAWQRNFKAARASNLISGEVSEGRELVWITA